MSNLWLNIRFGCWHLQAGDPSWWKLKFERNNYHDILRQWELEWTWFKVYKLLWYRSE